MDDEAALQIAETIMREQNVDNLQGFGDITIGRVRAMLMNAVKTGYITGYSEGFREAEK
jgi:hypothetical protein